MSSSKASAMQAFLDSNLGGEGNQNDDDQGEEASALSNALDDQSYHIVQHLIHELGESRTKEERIRQEFETFRQWIKKISVPDLIKDVEVVMDENERLLKELHNKSREMDRMSSEVDKLRSENYDYKMKIISASKKAQEAQTSKDERVKMDKVHKEEVKQLEGQVHELVLEIDDLQESLEKMNSTNKKLTSEKYAVEKQLREAHIEQKKIEQQMKKINESEQTPAEGSGPAGAMSLQEEMEEELQDMQHMLEEAVKGKHDLKREVERLTQEVLVLKAAQGQGNSSASIGNNKKADGDDDDSKQKKHVKSKTRDLKRIKELEKALQEMMDDNDQLESMLEDKCKKVDRLNSKVKDVSDEMEKLQEQQRENLLVQKEQQDDILFLREENEKQKARHKRSIVTDEQKQYAAPLDTAEAIRLQEEQIQLQDEFHQFRTAVKSDSAATDALVEQMSLDLESMRELAEQVTEENAKVKVRNEALMDLVSSCSCRQASNMGQGDNRVDQRQPERQQDDREPNSDSNDDVSNEQCASKASARLMTLIRDRFHNQEGDDHDNDALAHQSGNHSDGDERSDAQASSAGLRIGVVRARKQRNNRNGGNNPRGFFGRRQRNGSEQEEASGIDEALQELNVSIGTSDGEKHESMNNQSTNNESHTNRGFPRWGRNQGNAEKQTRQPKEHLLARRHSLEM